MEETRNQVFSNTGTMQFRVSRPGSSAAFQKEVVKKQMYLHSNELKQEINCLLEQNKILETKVRVLQKEKENVEKILNEADRENVSPVERNVIFLKQQLRDAKAKLGKINDEIMEIKKAGSAQLVSEVQGKIDLLREEIKKEKSSEVKREVVIDVSLQKQYEKKRAYLASLKVKLSERDRRKTGASY